LEVNVRVKFKAGECKRSLAILEERQGSHQLRAGVSGRDAEKWPSNAIFCIRKSVPVPIYVSRRVEYGGLTAAVVVVQRAKGGSV
jgi:hypothetical protein